MNLLDILRERVQALPTGSHSDGLRAVLRHIEVALSHLKRGQETPDETAFTDAIYRTNQGFEGSLKEAYRVLAGKDPAKVRPHEIEQYFQKNAGLRARVLAQFTNYRTEWRNPSTHDHRLDFDEDEALLAIVSVCAFAIVLIDQIAEKLSFEATRSSAQAARSPQPSGPLLSRTIGLLKMFAAGAPALQRQPVQGRASHLTGSVAGFLSAHLPSIPVNTDVSVSSQPRLEADMIIGDEQRIVIELKMSPPAKLLVEQAIEQVLRYGRAAGIHDAIVYFHPADANAEMITEERHSSDNSWHVVVVRPRKWSSGSDR